MSECRLRDKSMLTVYSGTVTINAGSNVRALIFLQDGRHLLSGSDDGRIRQWRVNDGVEVGQATNTGGLVAVMAVSPDGNWIVCGGHQVATVWNMNTRQRTLTINEFSSWVSGIDVSPDSSRFATGSNDSRGLNIWDVANGTRLVGPLQHNGFVRGVKFSPNGDRIATGDQTTLRIYNAVSGELLRTILAPFTSWPSPPILWSAQSIFAISSNTLIHLDANTGQTFSNWTIPGAPVNTNFTSIALARNSRFVASCVGNSISLWDPSTSARISSVITNPSEVWSSALSLDSKYLASSIAGGVITIRNLDSIIPAYYLVGQQPPGGGADVQLQIQALRDELLALLQSRIGAFLGNPTFVRLTANPNQMSRGAGVPILNPFALKHKLHPFRMVLTASKATSAIYTSHAYKTEPARLSCNHRVNPMFLKEFVMSPSNWLNVG